MANTGYKAYLNLSQYFIDNNEETGITKSNSTLDPDYIPPILDLEFCPLPSLSSSPPPTPTVTPSVTPTITPTSTPSVTITPSVTRTPSITPSITITPTRTPSVTISPSVTPSTNFKPTVTSLYADVIFCAQGQCNDYLKYSIYLNSPATTPVNYSLNVTIQQFDNGPGGGEFIIPQSYTQYESTLTVVGTIPVGAKQDNYNLNPCDTGGGVYVGCSIGVTDVCINYVDDTVTIGGGVNECN